jgi:hypothetical protein
MKQVFVPIGIVCLTILTVIAVASPPKPGPKPAAAPAKALTVGKPVTRGNMIVFPVYAPERPKVSSAYLTLEEALRQKLLVVKELPSAEVNRVSITNDAEKPVYLMAGDIILGGQQDRTVARDTIVSRGAKDFAVEVFCVEHGRWEGGQHFSGGEIASASLRREAQVTKQQQKVWEKVAMEVSATKAETPSGTYRAVAGNKASQKEIDAYVAAVTAPLAKDARATGVVVAINGTVTAADVFADHALFTKQLPKILKSYALDATQEQAAWAKLPRKPQPTPAQAVALLTDAERGQGRTTATSGDTINRERESDSAVVFDAAPAAPAGSGGGGFGGGFAHRNIYRKK